jgi:hypothetical protein
VNNVVIYIRFADQSEFELTREYYDQKFNDHTTGAVSMYNYYQEVSYGNLELISHHFPPCEMSTNLSYQDSHPREYFSPYSAANTIGYNGDYEYREREHIVSEREPWIAPCPEPDSSRQRQLCGNSASHPRATDHGPLCGRTAGCCGHTT